jgi:hypothetical protein
MDIEDDRFANSLGREAAAQLLRVSPKSHRVFLNDHAISIFPKLSNTDADET